MLVGIVATSVRTCIPQSAHRLAEARAPTRTHTRTGSHNKTRPLMPPVAQCAHGMPSADSGAVGDLGTELAEPSLGAWAQHAFLATVGA